MRNSWSTTVPITMEPHPATSSAIIQSRLYRACLLLISRLLDSGQCVEDALPRVGLDALFLQPAVLPCDLFIGSRRESDPERRWYESWWRRVDRKARCENCLTCARDE